MFHSLKLYNLASQTGLMCRLKAMREEAAVEPSTATAPVQENGAAEEPAPEKRSKRSRAGGNKESSKAAEPTLKFRNYNVRDDKISHTVLEPAKPPEFREPTVDTSVQNRPQVCEICCNCQSLSCSNCHMLSSLMLGALWQQTTSHRLEYWCIPQQRFISLQICSSLGCPGFKHFELIY